MKRQRTYYIDRYNNKKMWEVTKLIGGYYLRQYIEGRQVNRGLKTSKKFLENIGILSFEKVML